jgi:hypothetical protein
MTLNFVPVPSIKLSSMTGTPQCKYSMRSEGRHTYYLREASLALKPVVRFPRIGQTNTTLGPQITSLAQ